MKTMTRQLMGSEKVISYPQFEEGDHVLVDGKPGIVKFNPGINGLSVFLPTTPTPIEILGMSVVGQWPNKWANVSVRDANEHLKDMAMFDWWEKRFGQPAILPNETDTRVDYEAWVRAFHKVYLQS